MGCEKPNEFNIAVLDFMNRHRSHAHRAPVGSHKQGSSLIAEHQGRCDGAAVCDIDDDTTGQGGTDDALNAVNCWGEASGSHRQNVSHNNRPPAELFADPGEPKLPK